MASTSVAVVAFCLFMVAGAMVDPCDAVCLNGYTCLLMQQCYDRHRAANSLDSMLVFPCSAAPGYVCCPPVPKRRVQPMAVVDPEVNKKLLPLNDCGQLDENRISVGQEAALGQFPWMALLAYKPNGSSGSIEYLCGGTLISNRYVLTAAHCVNDDRIGQPIHVRLGEHDLTKDEDCTDLFCSPPPVDVPVEKVIVHSMYNNPHYLKNDIALLRLKDTVAPTLTTLPICLPFGLNITGEEEKKYTVAGWGKVEDVSVKGSETLLFTFVPSAPVSECNLVQTEEVKPINELQLCAGGSAGHDACKGDSGGPLMDTVVKGTGSSRLRKTYQIGIVSFGSTPCGSEIPSVYTRVTSYLNWILSNLEP